MILSRADQSFIAQWWWTVDRVTLFVAAALCVIGVGLVATASPAVAVRIGLDPYHFLQRHIIFACLAFLGMIALSFFHIRFILPLVFLLFVGSIVGVLWASFFGSEIKGAQRWIRLMGFSLQPSEFLKPAIVVCAGFLLAQARIKERFRFVVFASGLVIFSVACLISQPDFGMSALIVFVFCVQLFLYGISLRYVFVMSAGILILVGLAYISFDHVSSRIDRFLSPETADTYQVDRSLDSFAQGGAIGVGPGQGEVKMSLPDAHADFIFSVAGEEFGFILTIIILSLYALILRRAFSRLSHTQSLFSIYAGGGIATLIFMQAFIHAGSAMSLLPAKGMTMPYVSYGGSSTLAIGATFGLLLSLSRSQR